MRKTLLTLALATLLLSGCASTQSYRSAGAGVYYSNPVVSTSFAGGIGWYSYPWSFNRGFYPGYGYGYGYGFGYSYGWGGLHGIDYGRFGPYWGYPSFPVHWAYGFAPYYYPHSRPWHGAYADARHYGGEVDHRRPKHKAKHKDKKKKPVRVVRLPSGPSEHHISNPVVGGAREVRSGSVKGFRKGVAPPQRLHQGSVASGGQGLPVKVVRREKLPTEFGFSVYSGQDLITSQRSASDGAQFKAGKVPAQRLHGGSNKAYSPAVLNKHPGNTTPVTGGVVLHQPAKPVSGRSGSHKGSSSTHRSSKSGHRKGHSNSGRRHSSGSKSGRH